MTTTDRMQDSTAPSIQDEVRQRTEQTVREAAAHDRIDQRLAELDREWDADRVLFTASGINALLGLALGRFVDRRWYGYVAVVTAFQAQHGIQGWCPPLAVLRRLKVRTRKEVEEERAALKALRGDFDRVGRGSVDEALAAARS